MNIFFLGGIFCRGQSNYIKSNSSGVIQNAADSFQKSLIQGLEASSGNSVTVINLPFVGSYPRRFTKIYFPATQCSTGARSVVFGIGFFNLSGLKLAARTVASAIGVRRHLTQAPSVLFVYSAHLPFVVSAIFTRLFAQSLKLCIIVPDLPEYMGETGRLQRILKALDSAIFYRLVGYFDYAVLLTAAMGPRLNFPESRFVVVEGIAPPNSGQPESNLPRSRAFLYSGTLAKRYGIIPLLEAFLQLKSTNVELWICGEGDGKRAVLTAATQDARIKYLGQLGREAVVALQRDAFALINPRVPDDAFTQFSFPSKVMEYLASGRPTIMHKLPGIPEEYGPYYIRPKGLTASDLSACMAQVIETNSFELDRLGAAAAAFVNTSKSAAIQGAKILQLVLGDNPSSCAS